MERHVVFPQCWSLALLSSLISVPLTIYILSTFLLDLPSQYFGNRPVFLYHRSCLVAVKDRGASWSLWFSTSIKRNLHCVHPMSWNQALEAVEMCLSALWSIFQPNLNSWFNKSFSMSCPECDARITLQASNGLFWKGLCPKSARRTLKLTLFYFCIRSWCVAQSSVWGFSLTPPMGQYEVSFTWL